jgi:hypothetical protein
MRNSGFFGGEYYEYGGRILRFLLTCGPGSGILLKIQKNIYTKHNDENQYTSERSVRELPVGARQWEPWCGIPFGVAGLN